MSVADELQTLNDNILAAYTTVSNKGGTVPTDKNTDNLADAIDSIPSGGSPTPEPLDPQAVYQQTRPADWLPMPTPVNNEIYLLVKVPVPSQEKDPGIPLSFLCTTSAGQYQVELGTIVDEVFVADSTKTSLVDSNMEYTNYLYYADWTDNPMTDGTHQVMVKITSPSGSLLTFIHPQAVIGGQSYGCRNTIEFRGRCETMTSCRMSTDSSGAYSTALKFFALEGANSITDFSQMFYYCSPLTAIPQLDTSSGTNFSSMFSLCNSLIAIPQLDTSKGTAFYNMFGGCRSLVSIPQLDTSSGTNFSQMFSACHSLTSIPQIDTSSGTDFSQMFSACHSLTSIPQLDTSSGTTFYSMFSDCRSLTSIPQLDTSEGTNFRNMFGYCYSLASIPQLNTSSGTDFSLMFQYCYPLTSIPQLDTSKGTNFDSMFSACYSLTSIPQLDTSSGTAFNNMFSGCRSLVSIPQLDTSKGTIFTNMFGGCSSLTFIPQIDTSSGTAFSSMFSNCYSLISTPQLDTSLGTAFYGMFYNCYSLTYIDFVGYDFTRVTNNSNRPGNTYANGGGIMRVDNKFQMSTGGFTGAVINTPQGASIDNPFYILIEDDQAMIPLGANATVVFTTDAYTYVVVPDSIYATYAADTYWATLGTRLKRRSEVTLPAWYLSL